MSKNTQGTKMMKTNKQLYGATFISKKELLRWLNENSDKIDWDAEPDMIWFEADYGYKYDLGKKAMKMGKIRYRIFRRLYIV